ncbi:MAG: flagellar biosynthesis protein FliQ [Oscillospiraceae bacterium]|nr:flagellar biosynthesis protein FliQ [Oscillospiraceae bacterium]
MDQGQIMDVFREALLVCLKLAGPMLIVSILIGLLVSIFQAATQIHEQTLTFVPKLLVIALLLLLSGEWMIMVMNDFVNYLFAIIATL